MIAVERWSITGANSGGPHRVSRAIESWPSTEEWPWRRPLVALLGLCLSWFGADVARASDEAAAFPRQAVGDGPQHIQERVIESVKNERLTLEVLKTSMPIKSADVSFTLSPTTSGGTSVTMTMDYVVKFGPLGAVIDALMMRKTMAASLQRLLAGLDHHVATGDTVGRGWSPAAEVA